MVSCPPTHLTGVKRLATGITMKTTDLGVIYRYVNLINGKGYTGWTIDFARRKKHHERMDGRTPAFHGALVKYGFENFRCDILEHNAPKARECFWIATFGDFGNGYNLTEGGDGTVGHIPSKETRQKMSDALKGKPLSAEHRQKLSKAKKGKSHSNKGKKHKSHSNKGKPLSAEHRQKLSEAHKGKRRSAEHQQKLTLSARRGENHHFYGVTGKNHPKWGIPPSAKGRQKISEARKGKNRLPEYEKARVFFFIDLANLPLKEKRQKLYKNFKDVNQRTIRDWVRDWHGDLN